MDKVLNKIYYNLQDAGSFSGVDALFRAAKERGLKKLKRKQVHDWLEKQDVYTLHKPARRRFQRNRVVVDGKDDQFQADLVDLSSLSKYNDGYTFLLTCIDILSKYAWAIPLKNKTGSQITEAFDKIVESGRRPKALQTDKGSEFLNRTFQNYLKEKGILFFTTHSETKGSVVERFNRTLKSKMWKYFTFKNTWRYIDVLADLMKSYNNSFHRSIQMKPSDVTRKNENAVWHTLYGKSITQPVRYKFQVGDQVRISKTKRLFDKSYLPNWTTEIFVISKRLPRHPPVYQLKDLQEEAIKGIFYEQELQKVNKQDDTYQIEAILKKRKRKGKLEYFIKWKGFPEKFNQWLLASELKPL